LSLSFPLTPELPLPVLPESTDPTWICDRFLLRAFQSGEVRQSTAIANLKGHRSVFLHAAAHGG